MADGAALIGHNNPPEATPYEAIRVHIEDLYTEAKGWLDGDPISTQGQADGVAALLDMIREAEGAADDARKMEAKPFDEGKAEIQARYNLLIGNTKAVTGKTVLAADACKAALKPWREARAAEAAEAARVIREEAEAKAAAAAEAARQAPADDLQAREDAEALFKDAQAAEKAAGAAEKSAKVGTGLRSYWSPVLVNGTEALKHYWATNREALEACALALAKADVLAGKRQIPGFNVVEEKRAV